MTCLETVPADASFPIPPALDQLPRAARRRARGGGGPAGTAGRGAGPTGPSRCAARVGRCSRPGRVRGAGGGDFGAGGRRVDRGRAAPGAGTARCIPRSGAAQAAGAGRDDGAPPARAPTDHHESVRDEDQSTVPALGEGVCTGIVQVADQ